MKTFGELKVGDTIYGMSVSASGKSSLRKITVCEIRPGKWFKNHIAIDFYDFNETVVEKGATKLHSKCLHLGWATSLQEAKKLRKDMEEYFRDQFKGIR
jgi:hypothetical protein